MQGNKPSLNSATFALLDPSSQCERRIDLPMRAFAGGFYKSLRNMYDYLDVWYQAQPFLFSFVKVLANNNTRDNGRERLRPHFVHSSNNHRIPPIRPQGRLFVNWVLDVIYVAVCYVWFTVCCFLIEPRRAARDSDCESLGQYLRRTRMPWAFVEDYLLPLLCSVATCSHEELLGFPASDVVEYKRRTQGAQHHVVSGGINTVQKKLMKGLDIRFGAMVTRVERLAGDGVEMTWLERVSEHDD
jgi:hypothetical protein